MSGNQSLERGLGILELLDAAAQPVGVRDIARTLGLSAATVQRLINTLQQFDYVQQDPASRRYTIGFRAFGLGASLVHKDRMVAAAQAELRSIATSHELNGYLGSLHGDRAIYILCVQSDGPIAIRNVPGELAYLHSTAMGKVLLAGMSDDVARATMGDGPLLRLTPMTITEPNVIIAQLAEIRADGYASVVEETILGVVSVGAPIRDAGGAVRAALSVAFAERSSPHLTIANVAPIIKSAAARVSRELGWVAPSES